MGATRAATAPTSPDAALDAVVGAALDAALAAHGERLGSKPLRVAVAYSGGGDSTALLHAASLLAARGTIALFALHVHHGLAVDADAWRDHCRAEAERLGATFDSERIAIDAAGLSLEGEARRLRYAALVRLCERHDCAILMTSHHADDQAETVLLHLLRGAGVGGLAATARERWIDDVLLLRPLLDIPAATLRARVAEHELTVVEDPSNQDRRFTRNALRLEVMPALRRIAPTVAQRLVRTADHAASMQALLDEIGDEDLGEASADLDVDRLADLSPARAANALRVWIARRGMRAPSAASLKEMLEQLLHATPDAQIALLHERQTLRLYRGRVSIDASHAPRAGFETIAWHGESSIAVPNWHGRLDFIADATQGFDALALREGPLTLRERRGGERMRLRADGPSRTLKNLYQEAGVPAWERGRLPLVYLDDRLIYAAGIGPHANALRDRSQGLELVRLEWSSLA